MDNDPCAARVYWSAITAAGYDSTVAGVLAGLLIAAAAALLVQWYQGIDFHTIALFGSGVPVLAFSTYLFTLIAGLNYPKPNQLDYTKPGGVGDNLCSQLWSQWLLAICSLFIGSAVLICGLGWALVSYADHLAVKLCEKNIPVETVEFRRRFFIRLNAWLSGAVITAATALLIAANVTYLGAIGQKNLNREIFGEKWYLLFFVYLFGLFFIGRSSYVVFSRTRSAMRANMKSCTAYAAGGSPVATDNEGIKYHVRPPAAEDPRFARPKQVAMLAAQEFGLVMWVALAALLAGYMTSGEAFHQPRGVAASPKIVIYVVVLYIIVRAIYVLIAGIVELVSVRKDDTPTNNEAISPADATSVERIRIKYSFGKLSATTYGVVFLAILGTFLVAALTQGPLWTVPRIIISLFLGGLYPAVVLAGLSSSVPAGEDVRSPKWETVRGLAFIPWCFIKQRFGLTIQLRDRDFTVRPGQLTVTRGVEHRPVAKEGVHALLIEPAGVFNTGNAGGPRTAEYDDSLA